ncbi:hypothetical protein [Devosia sp. Root635]|uniref:hypothetical protein n=1 Tax=Devosia sp. Root635 TaxID=1736575 RepID=UPI0006FEFA6C|nr:hypothetical protein [Devosia sp. Root635]KRA52995.1 hypothetical protein ASD80_14445 [Devosia sp. Root635]
MFEAFLVTSSSEGLRALGQKEQRSYELITDAVRDRLGSKHANLFGEAVPTVHGDQYDWYAPVSGKAEPMLRLDAAQQAEARLLLDSLVGDILREAARLKAMRSLDDVRLGEALENAVRVPGDEHVYIVQAADGLQPVLVNWAWTSDEQRAVRGVLSGVDPRLAAMPVAAGRDGPAVAALPPHAVGATVTEAPPDRRGWGWLWLLIGLGWLLLAILIATIILLLVRPCGLALPFGLNFCPPVATVSSVAAETGELENQIAALERQLADADRACQPPEPLPAPVAEPAPVAPPVDEELEERMENSGATRGELTFTLAWDDMADVDLMVTCPAGQTVSYRERNACGGSLDVDSNASDPRADPIENIYFSQPAPGAYQVRVNLYAQRNTGPVHGFRLTIQDGDHYETYQGQVTPSNEDWTMTYTRRGQE